MVPIGALRTDAKDIIVFKHVYVIPVHRPVLTENGWDDYIAWYGQYTIKNGRYLGRTKTLEYLKCPRMKE